ncbi:hypothetical protein [Hydrocarboniphaga effusa]|uniref:hypothetical protein n=1 Tax=Hydrocarboniphaga effusa TaxID=243629 RepID=UPI0035B0D16E
MTQTIQSIHATTPQLLKATGIAIAASAVLLVAAVLPAEYGIDPTGVGKALGLTALSGQSEPATQTPATAPAAQPAGEAQVVRQANAFHDGEMSLTLQPNEGAEIKAAMKGGDGFVFAWTASGPVNFDMHGEAFNAKADEFTSYWKDRGQSSGNGSFTAPFDGNHGWYWRNRGTEPVIVTVKVSGYFEKLFRPEH